MVYSGGRGELSAQSFIQLLDKERVLYDRQKLGERWAYE